MSSKSQQHSTDDHMMNAVRCCMLMVLQLTSIYTCVTAADEEETEHHHHHRAKRLSDVVCEEGTTKIIPPFYHRDNAHDWCLIAAGSLNNDFYNMDYRLECQRWFGGDLPADVAQAQLSYCWEDEATSTVRYRMGICCRGTTTEKRCFQGEASGLDYDTINYIANYDFQVVTCQADEVCQNRYTFYGFGGSARSVTLTKSCNKTADCAADSSVGSGQCRDCVLDTPSCTTCCDTPFCNYNVQSIRRRPGSCPPCESSPCHNSGSCVNSGWNSSEQRYDTFTCWCTIYWSGTTCTDKRPLCTFANPCLNGGVCYDRDDIGPGMYRCDCTQPYYGDHCELTNSLTCNVTDDNYREVHYLYGISTNINCTQLALRSKGHPERAVWGANLIQRLCANIGRTANYRIEFELMNCSLGNGPDWSRPIFHSCCYDRSAGCETSNPCLNGGTCYDYSDIIPGDYRCECVYPHVGDHCELSNHLPCDVADPMRVGRSPNPLYTNPYRPYQNCSDWVVRTLGNPGSDVVNGECRNSIYRQSDGHQFVQGVDGQINRNRFKFETTYCARNAYIGFARHEICCPSCLSSPCLNGGYCLQRTYNQYICQCQIGFNGVFCENKLSVCLYTGDPHIKTFDNRFFDYQGTCKQVLASPCNGTDFKVFVEGENVVGVSPSVSLPRYVEVYYNGDTVRMTRNPALVDTVAVPVDITLNGLPISPPYMDLQGTLQDWTAWEMGHDGRFVRFQVPAVGLSVAFDGRWTVEVEIPTTLYPGGMCGLCGDNDNDPSNDLRLADGTDVSGLPDAGNLVGNSYVDATQPGCLNYLAPIPLSPILTLSSGRRKRRDIDPSACTFDVASCRLLNDSTGVFGNCIRTIGAPLANSFAAACVMDACYTGSESICLSVKTYVDFCTFNGATLPCEVWQTATNCPGDGYCPAGMIYKCLAPACRATCADSEGADFCRYAHKDSCVCPEGQLLFNGTCTDTCPVGCLDDNTQLHLVDEVWPGPGCTTMTCNAVCENCTEPTQASSAVGCPSGAVCFDGERCALWTTPATTPKNNNGKKPTTKSNSGIHLGQTTTATKKPTTTTTTTTTIPMTTKINNGNQPSTKSNSGEHIGQTTKTTTKPKAKTTVAKTTTTRTTTPAPAPSCQPMPKNLKKKCRPLITVPPSARLFRQCTKSKKFFARNKSTCVKQQQLHQLKKRCGQYCPLK